MKERNGDSDDFVVRGWKLLIDSSKTIPKAVTVHLSQLELKLAINLLIGNQSSDSAAP